MALDYTDQPVTIIEWSALPEYGDENIEYARRRFENAMSALKSELSAGGQIVGFRVVGSNPTWYTVLIQRAVEAEQTGLPF